MIFQLVQRELYTDQMAIFYHCWHELDTPRCMWLVSKVLPIEWFETLNSLAIRFIDFLGFLSIVFCNFRTNLNVLMFLGALAGGLRGVTAAESPSAAASSLWTLTTNDRVTFRKRATSKLLCSLYLQSMLFFICCVGFWCLPPFI